MHLFLIDMGVYEWCCKNFKKNLFLLRYELTLPKVRSPSQEKFSRRLWNEFLLPTQSHCVGLLEMSLFRREQECMLCARNMVLVVRSANIFQDVFWPAAAKSLPNPKLGP